MNKRQRKKQEKMKLKKMRKLWKKAYLRSRGKKFFYLPYIPVYKPPVFNLEEFTPSKAFLDRYCKLIVNRVVEEQWWKTIRIEP